MLSLLKSIVRKSPIGAFLQQRRERQHQLFVQSISSDEPIYPLYCLICKKYYKEFQPLGEYYDNKFAEHGFPFSIHKTETLNTKQYMCHGCRVNDRDRLYAMYLQKVVDPSRSYDLVEFAPSPQLSSFIHRFRNIRHRTADLFMDGVDDKVDLMKMTAYKDASFDIFICSHILEHVDDDVVAMKELYRILKPGGFGIAMVPLFIGVEETKEDPTVKDEALRWKHFGQDDHIRLYKRSDFISRLEGVGFRVEQLTKEYFGEEAFRKNGISLSSVLYIVHK